MSTTFKQTSTTDIISGGFTFGVYLWSTPTNWTTGVPTDGGVVTFNIAGGGNPSGYDDIGSLFLESLTLTSGFVAVGGAVDLSHGASLEIGTVSFGSTTDSVYSDTNLGSPSATLLIDGFSNTGTYGRIAATGANALTEIRSATDPGEIYQVDGGGELVLDPAPLANAGTTQAGFYYQNSGTPAGTFAFRQPGNTITLPLASVAIGDSIALPGSFVASVTYGPSSIVAVTNQGTVDFTDVIYFGTQPTGFIEAPDPISGLERITFTTLQSTSFLQTTTNNIISNGFTFGTYLWSTAANWTNGVPTIGSAVTFNVVGGGNPSGYDDIGSLFLDSLTLTSGFVAVGGAADLSHGASLEIGTVSFGSTTNSVYSDTNLGSPSATLVIDGFSNTGTYGRIAATGANALTDVRSATDPGEIYQVDGGGELVLDATPLANAGTTQAGFYYQNSGTAAGTFAFRNPGSTITLPLASVAIGDSIALPGSVVASVTYGPSSIIAVTNQGTVDFTDVSYFGTQPTGFTAAPDPISGLQRITFTSQQSTSFQQTTTSDIVSNGFTFGTYLWSTAANWTNGVPSNGSAVTFNVAGGGNPSGYDDISNLFLDRLTLTSGFVAVGGAADLSHGASLEIGTVSFGSTTNSVYSDTNLGSPSATLVIDGFSNTGTYGRIAATGANALTEVRSATDPGEIYQVDGGGELVLDPTPLANAGTTQAGFYYQNSGTPAGTFAFRKPSGTIALPLASVAIGDSIALPGSFVSSVTYGASSIIAVTSAGTVDFSQVSYSGTQPTGFIATPDPISGLERITFTSQQSTSFQQASTSNIISNGFTFGVYLWSTAANWTNGVPSNGSAVTFNVVGGGNPSGYDDIDNLFLDRLTLTSGFVAVGGAANLSHGATLEIGSVSFGSTTSSVYSDTNLGSPAATLLIDGFSNNGTYGRIAATGANAFTDIHSATDPGEIYQVDGGGELVLDATPLTNAGTTQAGFYYQNSGTPSGTFAFRNPGSTIALPLASVAIGDAIALPGSFVASVGYGPSSIAVVTNLGTTTFSNVSYVPNEVFTGFTSATDPLTGLQKITFAGYPTTSFQQTTTTNIISNGFTFGVYLWSTPANWTQGVPGNGAGVTQNIIGGGNPSGYDDISNLFLNNLNLTSGFIAVGGAADLSHGASLEVATLGFGTTTSSVYSDTNLGSPSATLLIDGFSNTGTYGRIAATGAHALTVVQAATDPGEIYQVDGGGELLLEPTPLANAGTTQAGFYYQNSGTPAGTFAFSNPGGTIALPLASVAIGDSIALPGSVISSVVYGTGSITVVTNVGTTVFSNVSYSGTAPTAFSASADPTGLERVTFTTATTFEQTTTALVGGTPQYLWSDPTNWTNGLPVNGSTVTFSVSAATDPGGYDDVPNLFVDTLHLNSGFLAVANTLTIGRLAFSEAGSRGIEANTALNGGSATVIIDAMSATNALVEATGTDAVTKVLAAIDPGEVYKAANGGMVVLAPAPRSTSQFNFGTGTFAFVNPGTSIASALNNVAIGDAIELPGSSVASVTYGANSLTVVTSAGTTTFSNANYLAGSVPTGFTAVADAATGLQEITFQLCFCQGTLIRTPGGEVPVERLAVGDDVVTWSGQTRRITWIGVGQVLATRGSRSAATPVIVRKGALGADMPHCDLRVTKGHSLLLDGALIPVEELINHRSILWDDRAQEVSIYHVELATHDVLVANGAPAESYRDDGNRWLFRNANSGWGLAAQAPCAPLLTGGALVDAVWRRLCDRAGPRPGVPLTQDAGLHLMVDGKRCDAIERRDGMYAFRLPVRPRQVRLVSRAAVPQELGTARDPRMLGVALRRYVLAERSRQRAIEAGDDRLCDGYHAFEPADGLRWTDGDASVPAALFAAMTAAGMLLVHLGAVMQYVDAGDDALVA
jgi:hypothetical protein